MDVYQLEITSDEAERYVSASKPHISSIFPYMIPYKKSNREVKMDNTIELWQNRLEQQLSSGLSIRKWCHHNHVSKKAFYKWRKENYGMDK